MYIYSMYMYVQSDMTSHTNNYGVDNSSHDHRAMLVAKSCSNIDYSFVTGDCERTLNLPISYMCDRYTISLPKSQSGRK